MQTPKDFCFALSFLIVPTLAVVCPPALIPVGFDSNRHQVGAKYYYTNGAATDFSTANTNCQGVGLKLATIEHLEDFIAIQDAMASEAKVFYNTNSR